MNSPAKINTTQTVNSSNPLSGLIARLAKIPGIEMAGMALLSLVIGLWLVNMQGDFLLSNSNAATSTSGCPMSVDGRNVLLDIDKSMPYMGRTVTCRQYDGHAVLIYTSPNR